ncbi:MAG: helix-turn-helix domain-containing protein [Alphaproteobacteria bacterium]|nr:helix-turn-helix domain-containing protein [Alphaproteobacteria bacterium]
MRQLHRPPGAFRRSWGALLVERALWLPSERWVVLCSAPVGTAASEEIARIAHRHACADDPWIPGVVASGTSRDDTLAWVVLDHPLAVDAARALEAAPLPGRPLRWAEALGGTCWVGERLDAWARATGEHTHAFGWCNVLLGSDGSVAVLLAPPPPEVEGPRVWRIEAPEHALGAPVGPSALPLQSYGLLQALMPFGDVPRVVARALAGPERPQGVVERLIAWGTRRVFDPIPSFRFRDVPAGVAFARRIAGAARMELEPEGLLAWLHACRAALGEIADPTLSFDGTLLVPGEAEPVDLSRRPVARRLVQALVAHRVEVPGGVLSASALREAGWPGERMSPEAASNRLHVHLSRLRSLGLEGLLEHVDGGWRLRPDVAIRR